MRGMAATDRAPVGDAVPGHAPPGSLPKGAASGSAEPVGAEAAENTQRRAVCGDMAVVTWLCHTRYVFGEHQHLLTMLAVALQHLRLYHVS